MEQTLILKTMQSVKQYNQTISAQKRVTPGPYNSSEEVAQMNKLDKSYFIKIKTSVKKSKFKCDS